MKLNRNIYLFFVALLFLNGCAEEESFKELDDQLVVYPIIFDDNNIADRREPVFNESDTNANVLTMRVAVHPPQPFPIEITYEIRKPTDLDEDTNAARDTLDYTILQDYNSEGDLVAILPANRDYVDIDVLQILNDSDPESAEEFIFYVTDASIVNVINPPEIRLREGSRQYRFNIRQSDDDIRFIQEEYFKLEGSNDTLKIVFGDTSDILNRDTKWTFTNNTTADYPDDLELFLLDTTQIPPVEEFLALDDTVLNLQTGVDTVLINYYVYSDGTVEMPDVFNISLVRIEHENGFLNLDESASITIYDNSVNPAPGELGIILTWDDLENVDLSLTLWEDTGLDTVEISSVNSPTDFETLILDQTLFSGTYLVTATWEGSTNEVQSADLTSYVAENGPVQDIDNVNSTSIAEGETVFLYEIIKDGANFINIDPQ